MPFFSFRASFKRISNLCALSLKKDFLVYFLRFCFAVEVSIYFVPFQHRLFFVWFSGDFLIYFLREISSSLFHLFLLLPLLQPFLNHSLVVIDGNAAGDAPRWLFWWNIFHSLSTWKAWVFRFHSVPHEDEEPSHTERFSCILYSGKFLRGQHVSSWWGTHMDLFLRISVGSMGQLTRCSVVPQHFT